MALLPPPPAAAVDPERLVKVDLWPGSRLYRIYDPESRFRPGPRTFRFNGPRLRFDHHQPVKSAPTDSPDRGIYYAAFDLEAAVVEVFGNSPRLIDRGTYRVARVRLRHSIRLLNLRGRGAMLAGTATGIAGTDSRGLTQAWARYFYEDPGIYENVAGRAYANAHNGMDAVALFERAEEAVALAAISVRRLDSLAFRVALLNVARRNGLTVV